MPLSRYRIIELGTGSSLAYCGKVLAGFGADVIKVETPGGEPARAEAPLIPTATGAESAYFTWLNVNKRRVTLDPQSPEANAYLATLLDGADIVLDSRALAQTMGREHMQIAFTDRHADLNVTAFSWFGASGPYSDFLGSDLACRCLAGLVALVGPIEKPVAINDHQADILAGLTGCIATLAGIVSGTKGRRFSMSVHEACMPLADAHVGYGTSGIRERQGYNRFANWGPSGIFQCSDGWIGLSASTPDQWRAFCALFDMMDLADDPRFTTLDGRARHAREIEARFAHKITERTAAEWFAEGLKRKLPFAIVPDMAALLRQSVHRENGSFSTIHAGARPFEGPALPLRLPRSPAKETSDIESNEQPAWRARDSAPIADTSAGSAPLAGLRLLDLSMGWAGPLATRMLADLGADIIKVESCRYPDWWRGADKRPSAIANHAYEKRPNYLLLNRNKRGITLDLTKPEGAALLRSLLAGADALIENYSSEVLPKLGLDYPSLSNTKDDLVMISMPAFPRGALDTARAYGATLEQASGLPSVAGEDGQPPMMSHYAYGDAIGGLNAAAALLIAVLHRRDTGVGQHVEISQVQCMLPMVAPWLIAQSVTGQPKARLGTRRSDQIPHDFYPCQGKDAWVLVAIQDDAMWKRLWDLIAPGEPRDPTLATAAERRRHERAIDEKIAAWTRSRSADDAMGSLQGAGIVGAAVRSPFDLMEDPHLKARGFWQSVDRPWSGRHYQPSLPIRENDKPYPVRHAAPTLGEFNAAVLGGHLGLSSEELDRLTATGVIGTATVPAKT